MSNSQKGIFTVIGATALASALILFNGNNEAEADDGGKQSSKISLNSQEEVVQVGVVKSEEVAKSHSKQVAEHVLIPPPLGPYHFNIPALQTTDSSIQSARVKKTPVIEQDNEFSRFKPGFPEEPKLQAVAPSAPALDEMKQKAPVLSKIMPKQPSKIESHLQQPKMISDKQVAPLNNHAVAQPPVYNLTPPVQRYMYVPVPMYPHQPLPPKLYYNPQNFNNGLNTYYGNGVQMPKNEPIKSEVVQ